MSMEIPLPGSDLVNPLSSQLGHLSAQDRAFLDAFNRQEQQELHGVPRPEPVDPNTLLGQLEQVTTQLTEKRLHKQSSVQSSASSGDAVASGSSSGIGSGSGHHHHVGGSHQGQRQHDVVAEIAPEEVRWFYKREVDKDWTAFMGYDSLRIELRYRHIWQTRWSEADRRTNTMPTAAEGGPPHLMRGRRGAHGGHPRGRRANSLNRMSQYERGLGNGFDDEDYLEDAAATVAAAAAGVTFSDDYIPPQHGYYSSSPRHPHGGPGGGFGGPSSLRRGGGPRGGGPGGPGGSRMYRSADNFSEDADMHVVVRGGVYEVDLSEWKCHSIYWPGEAFDILRGTWFHEHTWQPVQCEYADRIEHEHLQRFLGHKMADYVWDANTSTRLEKQVHHTTSFPEFHVDWMSPEEVYLHRENTSSQIYRGISASLGFKKPAGYRLFRGFKDLAQHTDKLPDITHIVFVVHGVGQVVDDTTIIRNTNILRDNVSAILAKHFPSLQKDTGQRVEFFPVEWRSSLRLDEGLVKHITPQRIMGLRNLLNSSAMDIMYYTSPLFRMEIWQTLQEELNRLYEMFVQRNPYFEANGGKVSIMAHSLGCIVTYDILTGWTQDVEHSWYNLQTRGGGVQDLKRSRRFRAPNSAGVLGGGPGGGGGGGGSPSRGVGGGPSPLGLNDQSGLLFRIENFFCLGSPLSVFLTLRWRDPTNQEYHDHILPRALCKYLYNVYHPCDPVAYRVEPVFMKFYSKVEPVHLYGAGEVVRLPYSELPLQPLQNARKEDEQSSSGDGSHLLPVNIANGSINISVGKMLPSQMSPSGLMAAGGKMQSMTQSLSLSKLPGIGTSSATTTTSSSTTSAASSTTSSLSSSGLGSSIASSIPGAKGVSSYVSNQLNGSVAGGAMNQVGQAAGGLFGGMVGLVKDAASAVVPEKSSTTSSTTTSTTSTRPGMPPVLPTSAGAGRKIGHKTPFARAMSLGRDSLGTVGGVGGTGSAPGSAGATPPGSPPPPHRQQQQETPAPPQPSYQQEVKLPDGQRLAYRMDYILREVGNTYIAAVTSHTSYWSNPDVAYFVLCKVHPEIEYCSRQKQQQQQQQQQQQLSQPTGQNGQQPQAQPQAYQRQQPTQQQQQHLQHHQQQLQHQQQQQQMLLLQQQQQQLMQQQQHYSALAAQQQSHPHHQRSPHQQQQQQPMYRAPNAGPPTQRMPQRQVSPQPNYHYQR